jgi:hypothetical protein
MSQTLVAGEIQMAQMGGPAMLAAGVAGMKRVASSKIVRDSRFLYVPKSLTIGQAQKTNPDYSRHTRPRSKPFPVAGNRSVP